jgi:hypothetical protein
MNWNFTANTPAELASIGDALFTARKQKFLDEQVQMTRLLEALPFKSILQFPVRVRHTGEDGVPDFQLEFGQRRIAAELAKIAVQDVEHARGLQRKGFNRTLALSSLYRKGPKPRTKDEVMAEGLLIPAEVFPVTLQEHAQRWADEAVLQLHEKTAVLQRASFAHGAEDWLVLWDRIGTSGWETDARIQWLAELLRSFWQPRWFATVVLQDMYFRWQAVFTPQEIAVLRPSNGPFQATL